jgi:chemotaxis protein MotB
VRRKKKSEHVNHERWLVSYADFITLLFAFFVVLFSSSQVDKRKVGRLALAIQVAFEHLGVFESSNSKMPLSTTEPMPFDNVQIIEKVLKTTDISQPVPSSKGSPGEPGTGRGMSRLLSDLQHEFDAEIKRNEISIRAGHEGVIISLREIGFFGSGSADVELKSEPTVARIAKLLRSQPYSIRIEGHTDNVPIHNNQFSSNWQLSTARAVGMTALFISSYGFPPDQISASGYAEFHPIASNLTPEGRFLNRRVDIVVLTGETLQPLRADGPQERHEETPSDVHPGVAPGS